MKGNEGREWIPGGLISVATAMAINCEWPSAYRRWCEKSFPWYKKTRTCRVFKKEEKQSKEVVIAITENKYSLDKKEK